MPGKSTYEIDEIKLRREIEKTDMNASEHSRAMGYESGFLHNSFARGRMNKIGIKYFESIGIPYELYKPDEKITVPKVNTEPANENVELLNEVKDLKKTVEELSINVRTIGNLLMQINEKVMK